MLQEVCHLCDAWHTGRAGATVPHGGWKGWQIILWDSGCLGPCIIFTDFPTRSLQLSDFNYKTSLSQFPGWTVNIKRQLGWGLLRVVSMSLLHFFILCSVPLRKGVAWFGDGIVSGSLVPYLSPGPYFPCIWRHGTKNRAHCNDFILT